MLVFDKMFENSMDPNVVYLIACRSESTTYLKIGKSRSLYQRLMNIKTGCPLPLTHAFIISSEFEEEVIGLEKLLHRLLKTARIRGEWYVGTSHFFKKLTSVLRRINSGGFSYDEINELPDIGALEELEIMLHSHDFRFRQLIFPLRKSVHAKEGSVSISPMFIGKVLSEKAPVNYA